MSRKLGLAALAGVVAVGMGACGPRALNEEFGTEYAIEVYNPHPHAMNVSAHIGSSAVTSLGQVPARSSVIFAIMEPTATSIDVIANGQGMTVTEDVRLERNRIVRVVLDDD